MEWWEDLYNRQIYFDLYEEADTQLAEQEVQQVVTLLHLSDGSSNLEMRPANGLRPTAARSGGTKGSILDLCCGYGRHSIKLAQHGFKVTGVDISKKQIRHAREQAEKAHVELDFQVADARKLSFQEEFEIVLNMFVSFGFFKDDNENRQVLDGVFRALKPGGKLLIDFWNREKEIRNFQPNTCEKIRDIFVFKDWRFDALAGRLNWKNTVIFPDGKRESWEHSVRAYTVAELKALIEDAGLKFEAVYGSLAGEEYTIDSPAAIIVATKPFY